MDSRLRLDIGQDGHAEVKTVSRGPTIAMKTGRNTRNGASSSRPARTSARSMPMRRSTCRSPRVTFARMTGYPASPEIHRRAREWPAWKRALLKRQMKISIGANGGCAMLARVLDTCPSANRLPVYNAPAVVAVHARQPAARSVPLFPRSPDRQSQYTPTCRFTKPMSSRGTVSSIFP